jgi:hypothetical protein
MRSLSSLLQCSAPGRAPGNQAAFATSPFSCTEAHCTCRLRILSLNSGDTAQSDDVVDGTCVPWETMKRRLLIFILGLTALAATLSAGPKPRYELNATIDYDLLTFQASARILVPAAAADPLKDVAFFIYANYAGIVPDERHRNISVDSVRLTENPVPFTLTGPLLRVELPQPMTVPFDLRIDYHGIVPQHAETGDGGGLAGLMGTSGIDLGSLLGGVGESSGRPPRHTDYGLYTYSGGMLSLGSYWYPQLAVRKAGRWIDELPQGAGDIGFSEAGDFEVRLTVPQGVVVAATGQADERSSGTSGSQRVVRFSAPGARDFAVLMSEDYVHAARVFETGQSKVAVEGFVLKKNEGQLERVIDIAGRAIQIFSERFGPYSSGSFKVVEGPIRGGAGGMEFSGLTSVASMLFQDWGKSLGGIAGSQGLDSLNNLLAGLAGNASASGARGQSGDSATRGNPGLNLLASALGTQMDMLQSLLEMTIAHEVAHQWWAMAVGSDSQRSPFVDESLTNYSAILYFEDRYGKAVAEKMRDLHLKTAYSAGRMLAGKDAPADLPASAYSGDLQYAAVVYGKGALYYDALRRAVGDRVFFESLREYYKRYSGRIAGPRSLLEIVEANAPQADVEALYRHWIEETHGDEDIGGGNLMGIGDLLQNLLQGLSNPQRLPAEKP